MPSSEPMWHDLGRVAPGAYEWLYFDVLNASDGTHVSIDFLAPNPFDSRVLDPSVAATDRVGVIACVSRPGLPGIEIATRETAADLRYDGDAFAIGSNSVERRAGAGGFPVYELTIDARSADAPAQRLHGALTFESVSPEWSIPDGQYYRSRADANLYHRWVVHAPRAVTRGSLVLEGPDGTVEMTIDGRGYHDHNFGTVPLATTVRSWFWARGSDAERTVIAAHLTPMDATRDDEWLDKVVYVGADGRAIAGTAGADCRVTSANPVVADNGVPYAPRVVFETTALDRKRVTIAFDHTGMAISGHPFYLRRFVDLSLAVGGEPPRRFAAVAEDIVFP